MSVSRLHQQIEKLKTLKVDKHWKDHRDLFKTLEYELINHSSAVRRQKQTFSISKYGSYSN